MTSITAASKAIDWEFAYGCVGVCWSLLHSSGGGRRRALQEIGDKRDATSISFRAFRFRLCLYRSGGGGEGSNLDEGLAGVGP